jgi:hypothetical protein
MLIGCDEAIIKIVFVENGLCQDKTFWQAILLKVCFAKRFSFWRFSIQRRQDRPRTQRFHLLRHAAFAVDLPRSMPEIPVFAHAQTGLGAFRKCLLLQKGGTGQPFS